MDDVSSIIADPRWFPLRYDYPRDAIQFAWLTREDHRALSFLTDDSEIGEAPRKMVARRELVGRRIARAPLHLIMHSGLTGSTLLARALDQDGVAVSLKEPPILVDIYRHRLAGATAAQSAAVLADVTALLARPFAPGEAVICKMVSVGNGLGREMASYDPASRILALHAPLPVFLESIARKGLWGRVWGRKLFNGLNGAGLVRLGMEPKDLIEQTDLQIGADAWLAIHQMMQEVARAYGPQRVRSIGSELLIERPEDALRAIAGHFGLALDVASVMASGVMSRHAKTGIAFDADKRAAELADARRAHGDEIEKVAHWARLVADTVGIPWDLPAPLA